MTEENKVVEYYDSIAKDYDDSRFNNSYGQFIDFQERRTLNRLISIKESSLRLEMACGTGRLTNYATHGLDASAEMMSLASQRHPDVEFKQASATETDFEDSMFDVVYTFHLLMHLDEDTIQQIFDEANRILKPGGRFIFDIPSKKRRNLLHHKQATWHGATGFDCKDVNRLARNNFELRSIHGMMMLPVHKLPRSVRKPLQKFDYLLANGWLKNYSSYLIYELQKR
ncbi:MAG: class I SAM-dependent methyltransferase [Prevotella sp.]|nr:class I SAM-dependent methyltransferase [Prevotella sp.]